MLLLDKWFKMLVLGTQVMLLQGQGYELYVLNSWDGSNNCWWGWQNKTDRVKCTHQYDEKQGNNKAQVLLAICQRRQIVKNACVLLLPCFDKSPKVLACYCFHVSTNRQKCLCVIVSVFFTWRRQIMLLFFLFFVLLVSTFSLICPFYQPHQQLFAHSSKLML